MTDVLTSQDKALLRSLEPKRLVTRLAVDSVVMALVVGGAQAIYFSELSALLKPGNLLGGAAVAALGGVAHVAMARRRLSRTSEETRLEMKQDWRLLTGRGWVLHVLGMSAAVTALFVAFSVVLVAVSEPMPSMVEVLAEGLSLFGIGFLAIAPLMFLMREAVVRGIRKEPWWGRSVGSMTGTARDREA